MGDEYSLAQDLKDKSREIHVFISYRNQDPSVSEAVKLAQKLNAEGYKTFIDKDKLRAGDPWASKIYDSIRTSDVLVVLLQPKTEEHESTAASEWVQREIDIARGANVSILPVNIHLEDLDISEVQHKLAIFEQQFQKYCSPERAKKLQEEINEKQLKAKATIEKSAGELKKEHKKELEQEVENAVSLSESNFKSLIQSIESLAQRTRQEQLSWWQRMCEQREAKRAPNKKIAASFKVTDKCTLHLSLGDLTDFEDIDVIVNSENNYMQMARIFERKTVSSKLRQKGARMPHGRLLDDKVQNDLNKQIQETYSEFGGLPVNMGEVIATPAGHDEGVLRLGGMRFILHAATISFSTIERKEVLTPVQTDVGIINVVKNCLKKFDEINTQKGKIYKNDVEQPGFTPVKSISFPIIATGHGGRSVHEVIAPMLLAIKERMDGIDSELTDIFIGVYVVKDVSLVKAAMKDAFGEPLVDNIKEVES